MPRLDHCHEQVVRALINSGWMIVNAPKHIYSDEKNIYIDLEAVRQIAGRTERICVEIKCLSMESSARDLYAAIGQYVIYRAILSEQGIASALYLAIPDKAYETLFNQLIRRTLTSIGVKIILIELETERITQWIE